MALNYRVSGISDITPAVIGPQQDFSPMHNAIAASKLAKERQAAAQEAEKAAKVKQAYEEALWNPGASKNLTHQRDIEGDVKGFMDFSQRQIMEGKTGSIEHNNEVSMRKQSIGTKLNKSAAINETASQALVAAKELPGYYDKTIIGKKIINERDKTDANGRVLWEEIDPKAIAGSVQDASYAINDFEMFKDKTAKLPTQVKESQSTFFTSNPNNGSIDSKGIKITGGEATFWKPIYDNKQNFVKWEPGVSNEAADAFLESDPEIAGRADFLLNKYMEDETVARGIKEPNKDSRIIRAEIEKEIPKQEFKRDYVKKNFETFNKYVPKNETKTTATFATGDGGNKDDEFKADKFTNQKRTTIGYNGKENVKMDSDVPEEYRFSGSKMDQPLKINTTKGYYEDNNKPITPDERTGEIQASISRVFLQAYDIRTGDPVIGKTESLSKQSNIAYRWVGAGTIDKEEWVGEGENAEKKTVKKDVLIPYDEISNDLKSKYGFDLGNRKEEDISFLEIMSQIKRANPKATPEQWVKIYKAATGK